MGLLDIDGDTLLSGLLSAGAASGAKGNYLARVAAGLATGERFRQSRSQEAMQKEFRDLQMKKLQQEMAQAEAAAAKQAKISQWTERLLGGGTSPGAFQTPVDGRGPVMPPSQSGIANASLDQVAGLHALGGPNLMDAYKFANTPQSFAAGSTMRNPVTGEQQVIPKLPDGMRMGASGAAEEIPGFGAANAGIKGAEAGAIERAKAGLDLVEVKQSDGSTRTMPRSQAINLSEQQPNPTPPFQNLGGNLSPALQAFIAADAAKNGITNPVARIGQPGQNMALSSEPALGVSQSPAAAAKVKFETDRDLQKPVLLASAKNQIAVIDKALKHPGLSGATGLQGAIDPRNYIPGTNATDFRKVLEQIQGAAFLQAFESLKGGGQITQVEGDKATNAIARLSRAQSTPEFVTSLNELRSVMKAGYDRLNGAEPGQDATPAESMEKLPPAQQHKGRTIRDTSTGKMLMSNGMSWVEKK